MKIIEKQDKYYPQMLLKLQDAPEKLFVIGDEKILNEFSIAIVGARKCTDYGENIAKSLAYNLARYDVNVVSGLAKGIDTFAHMGSIMGKGKTIAVLGSRF